MAQALGLTGVLRFKFLRLTQETSRIYLRYDTLQHRAVVFHPDLGLVADLNGDAITALACRGMLVQYGESRVRSQEPDYSPIDEHTPGLA